MRRAARHFGTAVAALVFVGAAGCTDDAEPEDSQDHTEEPAGITQVPAGTLLTKDALAAAASAPSAAENWRVTYQSESAEGAPIVVSGSVSMPAGEAPEGGWPVLSWGHGTTGYADVCAPSAQGEDGLASDGYLDVMTTFVDGWVAKGYVVVRTDYEGLGTPGGHPYMNAVSAANSMTDIVRAARNLDDAVGATWVAMGHSQGGHAALAAAQMAPERAPELDLRGAVSIAPGGVGLSQTPAWARSAPEGSEGVQPYIPLIVLGAQAGDDAVDAASLLSKDAGELLDFTRSACPWGEVAMPDPIPMERLFAPDADLRSLESYLEAQDPLGLTPAVPVLLQAGRADVEVAVEGVQGMRQAYCAAGVAVAYRDYEGLNHVPMLVDPAPGKDAAEWIDYLVHGGEAANDCA